MKTFWQDLAKRKKPFFVLAPMEDVTNSVFRRVVTSVAAPEVFFTEFTSVEGLMSEGSLRVGRRLEHTEKERPLIAQIWGLKPENFYKASKFLVESGFDGIDLNMGCPTSDVTSKGACSALIKNPNLAREMIDAVKRGVEDGCHLEQSERSPAQTNRVGDFSPAQRGRNDKLLPISVKTRIGYHTIQTEEWLGFLLEQNIDALTVHGRTVKEMSKVPAHWDEIGKAVKLRDSMKKPTVIIGNGDVKTVQDGLEKAKEYNLDGIMVGRGIFENIWFFDAHYDPSKVSITDRLTVLRRHIDLYDSQTGEKQAYQTLKKYYKIYIRDFDGASELRMKLMETKTTQEVRDILDSLL